MIWVSQLIMNSFLIVMWLLSQLAPGKGSLTISIGFLSTKKCSFLDLVVMGKCWKHHCDLTSRRVHWVALICKQSHPSLCPVKSLFS